MKLGAKRMSTTPTDEPNYERLRDEKGRFLKRPEGRISEISKQTVYVGHSTELRTGSEEIVDRFQDVKASMREREPFEVTNEHVMSVLLDLYWIHNEHEVDS